MQCNVILKTAWNYSDCHLLCYTTQPSMWHTWSNEGTVRLHILFKP